MGEPSHPYLEETEMFKKLMVFFAVVLWASVVFGSSTSLGPVSVDQVEVSDTYIFQGKNSSGTQKIVIDTSGNIDSEGTIDAAAGNFTVDSSGYITAAAGAYPVRQLPLHIENFTVSGASVGLQNDDPYPRLAHDTWLTSLAWEQGNATPADINFIIPSDFYSSFTTAGATNATFTLFGFSEGDENTAAAFDYWVTLNRSGQATATSYNIRTTAFTQKTATTPESITLSIPDNLDTPAAGDLITLRITRNADDPGKAKGGGSNPSHFYSMASARILHIVFNYRAKY